MYWSMHFIALQMVYSSKVIKKLSKYQCINLHHKTSINQFDPPKTNSIIGRACQAILPGMRIKIREHEGLVDTGLPQVSLRWGIHHVPWPARCSSGDEVTWLLFWLHIVTTETTWPTRHVFTPANNNATQHKKNKQYKQQPSTTATTTTNHSAKFSSNLVSPTRWKKNEERDAGSNDSCSVYLETKSFPWSLSNHPHHPSITPLTLAQLHLAWKRFDGLIFWYCNGSNWSSARWRCGPRPCLERPLFASLGRHGEGTFLRGKKLGRPLSDAWNEPRTAVQKPNGASTSGSIFLAQYGVNVQSFSEVVFFGKIRKKDALKEMKSEGYEQL